MVKVINNEGCLCVESQLVVDQKVAEILKKESNKECIENICKDFGVRHTLKEEDGDVISIVGKQFNDCVSSNHMRNMDDFHHTMLDAVCKYDSDNKECEQVCDDMPVELQKLIQEFGIIIVAVPKDFVV